MTGRCCLAHTREVGRRDDTGRGVHVECQAQLWNVEAALGQKNKVFFRYGLPIVETLVATAMVMC